MQLIKSIFEKNKDLAIFIARIILGGIFAYSGWVKVVGMEMTLSYFGMMHIPAFLTYIVSYGELIAGVLIILGLWMELALGFAIIVMSVAVWLTRSLGPQVVMTPLSVLGGLLALVGSGVGKYKVRILKGN